MKTVGGLLLAAGQSSRMAAGHHKLLAEFDGVPLVRRSAETMLRSKLDCVTIVTGHRSFEIEAALWGLPLFSAFNKEFVQGMGTSLACGFRNISHANLDGVLVMLADMPDITAAHINELLMAFQFSEAMVVRGSDRGKPGHPVIMPSELFSNMCKLDGDQGARDVLQRRLVPIRLVDIGFVPLKDVDTTDEVLAAGGRIEASELPQ
jgi:molybdenum cofactor cytidylyltransferase